jgi:hypothetical protein
MSHAYCCRFPEAWGRVYKRLKGYATNIKYGERVSGKQICQSGAEQVKLDAALERSEGSGCTYERAIRDHSVDGRADGGHTGLRFVG